MKRLCISDDSLFQKLHKIVAENNESDIMPRHRVFKASRRCRESPLTSAGDSGLIGVFFGLTLPCNAPLASSANPVSF